MKLNRKSILISLTWLLIAGCMCVPPGFSESSRPPTSTTPPDSIAGTQLPASPDEVEATEPAITPNTESAPVTGLLVLATETSLWTLDSSGANLQQLVKDSLPSTHLRNALQPGGANLAVITSNGDQIHDLTLELISLPDGNIKKVTNLTSSQTEPQAESGPGDPGFEAIRAITETDSLAWSPDGQTLAFIAYMNGSTADVYLYNIETQKTKRVTRDKNHHFGLSWSPDGKKLFFLGADSFGTGAGISMSGVWLANGDGSNVSLLYKPDSSGEELMGWLNNTTLVLSSWSMMCGNAQLRLYDINSKKASVLQKDCFSDAAISPEGNLLFGTGNALYLLKTGTKTPKSIMEGNVTQIEWDDASSIFVIRFGDGKVVTLDRNGADRQESPIYPTGQVAAYGAIWAWSSIGNDAPGVWISGPGLETRQIFNEKASSPIWDSKNNLLFFASDQIYRATFPDYNDTAPVSDFSEAVNEAQWVGVSS